MAAVLGRFSRNGIFKVCPARINAQKAGLSTFRDMSMGKKVFLGTIGVLTGGATALVVALNESVKAEGLELHPPSYPWYHKGFFQTYDYASVRRGYEIYKQVCAACHSLQFIAYRNLADTFMSEAEAKREAEEIQVQDGPNETGEMFMRPGKLSDYFPKPYANDEAARAANNGALPPDLSYIVNARHGGEDYIFSLLTSYTDPPAGVTLQEGQHYNPYFLGGAISMAQALYNDIIQYGDETPPTQSQLAKDICVFLKWAAEPELDDRKRILIKGLMVFPVLIAVTVYWKRMKWSLIKTRKIEFRPTNKKWK